ncbi:MAG: AI-2E family transporter [Rhodobacterales bacterium]|nr:MAG: AI-2E family transporter [Rhodobacterales bacterium]
MALPVQTQAKYWSVAAILFFAALWLLGDVILPFVIGGAIAYFLDPVADRLENMGLSRVMATVLISVIALLVFTIAALMIVPLLVGQTVALAETVPALARDLHAFLLQKFPNVIQDESVLSKSLATLGTKIQEYSGTLFQALLSSAQSVISVAVMIVVVPVVAFYMLLDWDHMIASIDAQLPRDHAPTIRRLAHEIDRTLASFVRGQGTVCLALGSYYALALMIIGLDFGIVVGFIAGLITFIPYVGALVGGALAIGLGLFQFWGEWWLIGGVAAIFAAGQFIEGNILTPKLVGTSVGLHPVWLMFALAAFGALFGFVGMLVAVPVAAVIGVLVRFVLDGYQRGPLYQGEVGKRAAQPLSDAEETAE